MSAMNLCSDCPPIGYPTDLTRCRPCPRRTAPVVPMTQDSARDGWVEELLRDLERWSAANMSEVGDKPHSDMPSRWYGRAQALENCAAYLRARAPIASPPHPDQQEESEPGLGWKLSAEASARIDETERANNPTALADFRMAGPSPDQQGELLGDKHRFGSPPEPVVNPSPDWCDAYAAWYYQEPL